MGGARVHQGSGRRAGVTQATGDQWTLGPRARVTSFQAFLESHAFGYFGLGWSAPRHIQWPCVVQGGAGVPGQPRQAQGAVRRPLMSCGDNDWAVPGAARGRVRRGGVEWASYRKTRVLRPRSRK